MIQSKETNDALRPVYDAEPSPMLLEFYRRMAAVEPSNAAWRHVLAQLEQRAEGGRL